MVVSRTRWSRATSSPRASTSRFTPEELKALEEKATNAIDIAEFVPLARWTAIYFEKAYYLAPDKGGERAYRLLAEAMRESGRAALARYAARGKQYLVLLRPDGRRPGDGTAALRRRGASVAEVPLPDGRASEAELKLARQLIEQSAADEFEPENYRDDVRERVLEAIQQKVEGQEITAERRRRAADQDHRPDGRPQGEPREAGRRHGGAEARPPHRGIRLGRERAAGKAEEKSERRAVAFRT